MFEYMTVQDAAKLWGLSERRVQKLCKENRKRFSFGLHQKRLRKS